MHPISEVRECATNIRQYTDSTGLRPETFTLPWHDADTGEVVTNSERSSMLFCGEREHCDFYKLFQGKAWVHEQARIAEDATLNGMKVVHGYPMCYTEDPTSVYMDYARKVLEVQVDEELEPLFDAEGRSLVEQIVARKQEGEN